MDLIDNKKNSNKEAKAELSQLLRSIESQVSIYAREDLIQMARSIIYSFNISGGESLLLDAIARSDHAILAQELRRKKLNKINKHNLTYNFGDEGTDECDIRPPLLHATIHETEEDDELIRKRKQKIREEKLFMQRARTLQEMSKALKTNTAALDFVQKNLKNKIYEAGKAFYKEIIDENGTIKNEIKTLNVLFSNAQRYKATCKIELNQYFKLSNPLSAQELKGLKKFLENISLNSQMVKKAQLFNKLNINAIKYIMEQISLKDDPHVAGNKKLLKECLESEPKKRQEISVLDEIRAPASKLVMALNHVNLEEELDKIILKITFAEDGENQIEKITNFVQKFSKTPKLVEFVKKNPRDLKTKKNRRGLYSDLKSKVDSKSPGRSN